MPEPNRWTLDALREYLLAVIERQEKTTDFRFRAIEATLEDRFEAQERAVQSAQASTQRALDMAAAASASEFRHVNEFRALVEEIQEQQMPRLEIIQRLERLAERIDKQESRTDDSSSRGIGIKLGWGWAVAVAMLAIAVASFFRK